jgi:hypothetical protein
LAGILITVFGRQDDILRVVNNIDYERQ